MVLIRFCCCWSSLRRGSYASAIYTMVYFIVTILMVVAFGESDEEPLMLPGESHWHGRRAAADAANASMPLPPPSSSSHDAIFSHLTDDAHLLMVLNGCVVTFAATGLATCFLLIYGLNKDKGVLLVPWIIAVTCTTALDFIYAIYLIIFVESSKDPVMDAMIFTGDFIVNLINVYAILCVISQFQEYREGRRSCAGNSSATNHRVSGEAAGASDAEVVPLNAVVTTATATTPVEEIRLDRLDVAKKTPPLASSWKEREITDKPVMLHLDDGLTPPSVNEMAGSWPINEPPGLILTGVKSTGSKRVTFGCPSEQSPASDLQQQ